jgi:CheY-like chemotaxis protein
MVKLINQQASQAYADHLREIDDNHLKHNLVQAHWFKLRVIFKKDGLFEEMTRSPLIAKRRVTDIIKLHDDIIERLTLILGDAEDAFLYAYDDKSIGLLVHMAPHTDLYQELFRFSSALDDSCREYLRAKITPITDKEAEQKLDQEKVEIASKEWAMYETLIDTTKRRTISPVREHREKPVVLVVEDDLFTGKQIEKYLEDTAGVIHVTTAEEAIKNYVDMAPDCVLLDIHLPGRSGFDALHCIRRIDSEANIILLTGDTVSNNARKAFDMGALNFIEKPLAKNYLVSAVCDTPLYRRAKQSPE